jgi:Fe-S-cluster containining protein
MHTGWTRGAKEVRSGVTIEGKPPRDDDYAPMPTGRGIGADVDEALARGGCPFQVRNLCGVHESKPLGCRVYFCDASAEKWQQDLSERLLGDLRAIHDRHGVEYRYGEWRVMLNMFRKAAE